MQRWLNILIILCLSEILVNAQGQGTSDPEAEGEAEGQGGGGAAEGEGLESQAETVCRFGGQPYLVGESYSVEDDPCTICECCASGKFKCKKKVCTNVQPPPCGLDHYNYEADQCCPKCSAYCEAMTCPPINCPGPEIYPTDSCCPQCACRFRGMDVPQGPVTEKPTAACEGCTCYANGSVICENQAPCPGQGLQCVDPVVLDDENNCVWICPNGHTCYRGTELIMPDEYKIVKDKVCYCHDWHPIALCANVGHWAQLEEILHEDRCLRKPIPPAEMNQETNNLPS